MRLLFIQFCVIAMLTAFNSTHVKATGYTGGQLTYTWLSDSTYQFSLNLYNQCADGILPMLSTTTICYRNTCTGNNGNIVLYLDTTIIQNLPPSYKHYKYVGNFTLPAKCNDWVFYINAGQRNASVNLTPNSNLYLEARINNVAANNSSSPFATINYSPLVVNNPSNLFIKHIDNDGDSIAYEIVMPRHLSIQTCSANDSAIDVSYNVPFGLMHPATASGNAGISMPYLSFNMGSDTGYYNFTIKASEYRNGVIIGSVIEEIQQRALLETNPFNYNYALDTANLIGCQYIPDNGANGNIIKAFAGAPFTICHHYAQPANSNNHIGLSYSSALTTFPGSIVSNISTNPDSLYSCFTYTPTIADFGKFIIVSFPDTVISVGDCYNFPVNSAIQNFLVYKLKIYNQISVSEQFTISIKIFPNPATDRVHIQCPSNVHATVLDIKGATLIHNMNSKEIDISNLPDGLYFIKLTDDEGHFIKMEKLIKTSS